MLSKLVEELRTELQEMGSRGGLQDPSAAFKRRAGIEQRKHGFNPALAGRAGRYLGQGTMAGRQRAEKLAATKGMKLGFVPK